MIKTGKPPHVQELPWSYPGHPHLLGGEGGARSLLSSCPSVPVLLGFLGPCSLSFLSVDLPATNQVLCVLPPEQDYQVHCCARGTPSRLCPWETNILGHSMLESERWSQ